jgi:hypothetical protein
MKKEELVKIFMERFTERDKDGNILIKSTPADITNWIADQFCQAASPPFSKAFTGMNDKNGKPIHEGDKVKLYHKGEYVICQVIYDTRHAAFFIKWPDGYVNQYFMNGGSYEVVE